jgi:hypothetical protein
MERNHEGEASSRPERRESLYISSIVIPADDEEPLRQNQLLTEGLADRQQLVGGPIQAIDLREPAARLFCNEEGKLMELPPNKRATLLLWMHNPTFRYQDSIVGDAFLVGPVSRGDTAPSVPEGYVRSLLDAARFRVELRSRHETEWSEHPERFDDWVTAYEHAVSWSEAVLRFWGREMDVRVVPDE